MVDQIYELINEIKKTVPTTSNLASSMALIDQFARVQELLEILNEQDQTGNLTPIVDSYKSFFQPILIKTVSYESDFIKVVMPFLRTLDLVLHTSDVRETKYQMPTAFSYQTVIRDLIEPTEKEIAVGDALFIIKSSSYKGLSQTNVLKKLLG